MCDVTRPSLYDENRPMNNSSQVEGVAAKNVGLAIAAVETALSDLAFTNDPVLCKAEGLLCAALSALEEAQPLIEDVAD